MSHQGPSDMSSEQAREIRDAAGPRLSFKLLGKTSVQGISADNQVSSRKGLGLLAFLAMHADQHVSRSTLADLLWSERGDAQARQNLRQTILMLRRTMGTDLSDVLQVTDQWLCLTRADVEVDALEFLHCAGASDPGVLERCLDAPWGAFLDGLTVDSEVFDEWAAAERQRFAAVAIGAFSKLAARFDASGDGERAILAAERLVRIDPGEEEHHRRLLRLEAGFRGRASALARAKSLAAMLKRELDAAPEPATVMLVEEIRNSPANIARRPEIDAPFSGSGIASTSEPERRPSGLAPAVLPRGAARAARRGRALGAVALVAVAGALGAITSSFIAPAPDKAPAVAARLDASSSDVRYPGTEPDVAQRNGAVSIIVLPFKSYREDERDTSLLAEMINDDLTNLLSRVQGFRVISRQTSMTYAARNSDATTIGVDLGVRYLLEGSVAMRGSVLRVNVELVDARSRLQVWSGRFEREGGDRFAVQDEIVRSIGRELRIEVGQLESAAASADPDVHELVFKGWAEMNEMRRVGEKSLLKAKAYFLQALAREPNNVSAQTGLGAYHTHMAVQLFTPTPSVHLAKAEEILNALIERHPHMHLPYALIGLVHIARNENDAARLAFERSIAFNPSHAPSHAQLGRVLVRLGQPRTGLEHVRYAMRLSPRDPAMAYWYGFMGAAELDLGLTTDAILSLERAQELHPGQPRNTLQLIAAYGLAGNAEKGRALLARLQKAQPHITRQVLLKRFRAADGKPGRPATQGMLLVLSGG